MFTVSYCEYYYITNIQVMIITTQREREGRRGEEREGRLPVLYCILSAIQYICT